MHHSVQTYQGVYVFTTVIRCHVLYSTRRIGEVVRWDELIHFSYSFFQCFDLSLVSITPKDYLLGIWSSL